MKKIVLILGIVAMFMCAAVKVNGFSHRSFTSVQQKRVDEITKICVDEWENYGVLPSVCLAQAMNESTMGEHCSGYNYWGIKSGKEHYSSTYEATMRYLAVINNGCYKGAPFETDSYKQIRKILDGGYCVPENDYYKNVVWIIEKYNLKKYDEKIFENIEKKRIAKEKKRLKKLREQEFTLVYDENVPEGTVYVNPDVKRNANTISMYVDLELYDFFEVKERNIDKNTIKTSDKNLVDKKCTCIFTNARG